MLRDQLRQQGVTTTSALDEARHHLRRTGLRLLAIIVGAAIVIGILFPPMRALIAVTTVLLLLWVGSSYLQTRSHLNAYARELSDAESPDARHNANPPNREDEPR